MRPAGWGYMTLDEVATEMCKHYWCCPRITAREVSFIERVALDKMRTHLRANHSVAEDLWAHIEGNPCAIERGAFLPVRIPRINVLDEIAELPESTEAA